MKEKHNARGDASTPENRNGLDDEMFFFILLSHRKSTPTPAPTCRADHRVWMSTDREETWGGGEVTCPTDGHENECIGERTGATRKTKQRLSKSRAIPVMFRRRKRKENLRWRKLKVFDDCNYNWSLNYSVKNADEIKPKTCESHGFHSNERTFQQYQN